MHSMPSCVSEEFQSIFIFEVIYQLERRIELICGLSEVTVRWERQRESEGRKRRRMIIIIIVLIGFIAISQESRFPSVRRLSSVFLWGSISLVRLICLRAKQHAVSFFEVDRLESCSFIHSLTHPFILFKVNDTIDQRIDVDDHLNICFFSSTRHYIELTRLSISRQASSSLFFSFLFVQQFRRHRVHCTNILSNEVMKRCRWPIVKVRMNIDGIPSCVIDRIVIRRERERRGSHRRSIGEQKENTPEID